MDTYRKTETVEAEQWNKLGDVKEAGVKKHEKTNDGWLPSYIATLYMDGSTRVASSKEEGDRVRSGDYIVKAYDIETDSTVYYPVPKEEFENLWSKVSKPEWEGDGDAYVPT
jgi:hypothetical protein